MVRQRVPPEVYESYHDIANRHIKHDLTLLQFREHLEQLFKNYADVLEVLPNFFSDSVDPI